MKNIFNDNNISKNNKTSVAISICSIFVFFYGIFIGYNINGLDQKNLQGYMLSDRALASNTNASTSNASTSNASTSNASTSNASTSNASTSNASTSNASTSNASTSNASAANATINDNILFLESYELATHTAKAGDKVGITLKTNGACNSGATIVLKSNNGLNLSLPVKDITTSPYILIPNNAIDGVYNITEILLVGTNSDGKTFTKTVTFGVQNNDLTIANEKKEETKTYTLSTLKIKDEEVKLGEKVYIDVKASEQIEKLQLSLSSNNGKIINLFVKDLNTKIPYVDILSSVEPGTYELTYAIVTFKDTTKIYSKSGLTGTEKFNFDSVIKIEGEVEETYIYNNEDVNDELLSKLYNTPAGSSITIYADSKTFVESDVFESIKGKEKELVINYKDNQIIFNGNNITNPKTIDVSMIVDFAKNNEEISDLVDNGIVVSFPDNGDLPGEAVVKIKSNEEVDNELKNGGYVYYYNKLTKKFTPINTDIDKTSDGYYKFNISHNSEYLLVNKKLPSSLIADDTAEGVNFIKSNSFYLIIIILGLLLIAGIVAFILIYKKNNDSNEEIKEEKKEIENKPKKKGKSKE